MSWSEIENSRRHGNNRKIFSPLRDDLKGHNVLELNRRNATSQLPAIDMDVFDTSFNSILYVFFLKFMKSTCSLNKVFNMTNSLDTNEASV